MGALYMARIQTTQFNQMSDLRVVSQSLKDLAAHTNYMHMYLSIQISLKTRIQRTVHYDVRLAHEK